ncbi:MAG: MmoB/DmpM family protein [Acidimicrobiia bacterium]
MSANGPTASRRITLCVMKGQDGDLMAESVHEFQPDVRIVDKGPYLQLESEEPIILDVEDIASRKGTAMTVQDVLVSFSSFVGRVELTDTEIRITPDLPQLDGEGRP